MSQCEGITRSGVRCKRIVSGSNTCCYQHRFEQQMARIVPIVEKPVVVPTDPVAHATLVKYVKQRDYWPDMSEIISDPNYKLYERMSNFLIGVYGISKFEERLVDPMSREKQAKYIFLVCEMYRLNKHIYFPGEKIYSTLLNRLRECKAQIGDYINCFRETVEPDYGKLMAKRRYIQFIFTHSDLGPLIAKIIAECYTD